MITPKLQILHTMKKYDTSDTKQDDYIVNEKDTKNTNNDGK